MSDPTLIPEAIIEAAARALRNSDKCLFYWNDDVVAPIVRGVLAAVTPLIRAAALEEAMTVCDLIGTKARKENTSIELGALRCRDAIRSLKEQP
jgi:hypothetical protein